MRLDPVAACKSRQNIPSKRDGEPLVLTDGGAEIKEKTPQ